MIDRILRACALRSEHPGREISLYAVFGAALAACVYWFDLPQPLFTLGIVPLPFFATRWPRWTLALALLAVFAYGSALSLFMAPAPSVEIRRIAIQTLALGALMELARRIVASRGEALASLSRAEGRYRLLVESLNAIPFEFDLAAGRFLYVGPQTERLLGRPVSAWRDLASWEAMIHPDDRAAALRSCRDATERGEDHEFGYRMLAADGRVVWIHDVVTVIREQGQPAWLRGVIIDVTERHIAAEERSQLERRTLEGQRLESLGILAGGVAHDFNNLLTPILGNISDVLETQPLCSETREQLRNAEQAAERAAGIARQMLAYSGRATFVVREENLSLAVSETARLLAAGISKRATLKLDLCEQPIWVRAEVTQLRQVVMNLLANAADAVEEVRGTVVVRTAIAQAEAFHSLEWRSDWPLLAGPCAVLEVCDDGAGMDAETRRRVFDPFFTTKPMGHGLGMAAVLGIIRAHGGSIEIESAPHAGTCVRVLLPLSEPPVASESIPRVAEAARSGAPRRVLVVDDEPAVRRIARLVLERDGYAVVEAGDGEEALAALRRAPHELDAVLLDMTMPRLSGGETLRALRELAPELPVVLMSGYAEQEFARDDAGGGTAFLAKPFRAAELRQRLSQLLSQAPL